MPDAYRIFENSLTGLWRSLLERLPFVLVGLLVLVLVLGLGKLVAFAIIRVGDRTGMHANLKQLVRRLVGFASVFIGILVASTVIFPAFKPGDLVAGLGVTTVAVSFAFKDILQNFFAGVLILWREPFKVGDELQFGDFAGVVEEINSRSTRIRTYEGERAVIPNGDIYTSPLLVKTAYDKRRVRLLVGIGYGDSIEEARSVIDRVLKENDGVLDSPGPWIYVSELAPSSVNLTVYFWTASAQANVLRVSDQVTTGIKNALDAAGIDMPFPHMAVLGARSGPPISIGRETE